MNYDLLVLFGPPFYYATMMLERDPTDTSVTAILQAVQYAYDHFVVPLKFTEPKVQAFFFSYVIKNPEFYDKYFGLMLDGDPIRLESVTAPHPKMLPRLTLKILPSANPRVTPASLATANTEAGKYLIRAAYDWSAIDSIQLNAIKSIDDALEKMVWQVGSKWVPFKNGINGFDYRMINGRGSPPIQDSLLLDPMYGKLDIYSAIKNPSIVRLIYCDPNRLDAIKAKLASAVGRPGYRKLLAATDPGAAKRILQAFGFGYKYVEEPVCDGRVPFRRVQSLTEWILELRESRKVCRQLACPPTNSLANLLMSLGQERDLILALISDAATTPAGRGAVFLQWLSLLSWWLNINMGIFPLQIFVNERGVVSRQPAPGNYKVYKFGNYYRPDLDRDECGIDEAIRGWIQ